MFILKKILSDSTIYKYLPTLNAGADPQLELFKYRAGEPIPSQTFEYQDWPENTYSRILIKLDSPTYDNGHHYLNIHLSTISNISNTENIDLEIIPITQEWLTGAGNRNDLPYVTKGVNWNTSNGDDEWDNYYNSSEKLTYSFNPSDENILIDITSIMNSWYDSEYVNHGIIIKFSDEIEESDNDSHKIRFYGHETNSIYEPTVISYYPDVEYTGDEFEPTVELPKNKIDIRLINIKSKYPQGSTVDLYVRVNNRYQQKIYDSELNSELNNFLINGYYQIIDTITGKIVVPMHEVGTKILKTADGYNINFETNNILPNRFYTIQVILVDEPSNKKYYFENNYNFKII